MKEKLYQIITADSCFGIVSKGDEVIIAPPIAKWTIGGKLDFVIAWYECKRDGIVKEIK